MISVKSTQELESSVAKIFSDRRATLISEAQLCYERATSLDDLVYRLGVVASNHNVDASIFAQKIVDEKLNDTNGRPTLVKAQAVADLLIELSQVQLSGDKDRRASNEVTNDDALVTQGDNLYNSNLAALEQLHNHGIPRARKVDPEKIRIKNEKYPPLTSQDFTFSETIHKGLGKTAAEVEDDLHNKSGTWFDEPEKVEDSLETPSYYTENYILNAVARNIKGFGLNLLEAEGVAILQRDAAKKNISQDLINTIARSFSDSERTLALIQFFKDRSNLNQTLVATDNVAKYADEIKPQLEEQLGRTLSDSETADLIDVNYKKSNAIFHLAIAEILINIAQNNPNLISSEFKTKSAMNRSDIETFIEQQVAAKIQTPKKASWFKRHPKTSVAMGTSGVVASLVAGVVGWQHFGASNQEINASSESRIIRSQSLVDESPERLTNQGIAKPPKTENSKKKETTNKSEVKQSLVSTERKLSFPGQDDLVIKFSHVNESDDKATQLLDKIAFYLKALAAPGYTGYEKFTNEAKVPFEKIDSFVYLNNPKIDKELLEEQTGKKITELQLWQEPIYLAKLENGTFMICFDNKFSAQDLMTHQIALQFRTALARKDSPIQQANK